MWDWHSWQRLRAKNLLLLLVFCSSRMTPTQLVNPANAERRQFSRLSKM